MNKDISSSWINLAHHRLGTKVLYATDDFFGEKENLIKPGRGIYVPDKYTDRGKWMDGWESRRKRVEGNDYCDIKLGLPGIIEGLDIDTNHFLGNHPPFASVEATYDNNIVENTKWTEILTQSPLKAGSQNIFEISNGQKWKYVRLHIYPDGGVARFRVYGTPAIDWDEKKNVEKIDLASILNGGRVVLCNDMFFSDKNNLIMPGPGINMGDGWETRRKRAKKLGDPLDPDWAILSLGKPGIISEAEIDTSHFVGNFPDCASLEGLFLGESDNNITKSLPDLTDKDWSPLLPKTKLNPDYKHLFEKEIQSIGKISHVRIRIYPDGGVSRLRLWGKPTF